MAVAGEAQTLALAVVGAPAAPALDYLHKYVWVIIILALMVICDNEWVCLL